MSEVKVDTISERTAAGGVTIDGVLIKDGVATFQTAAGSPLVFEGATADAFETTFAFTDPTADRTITFPDASITLAAGGDNTPSFGAYLAANQSISNDTWTKITMNTEEWDTDSAFDHSTNYRFTVPAGEGGKYSFSVTSTIDDVGGGSAIGKAYLGFYKNGSLFKQIQNYGNDSNRVFLHGVQLTAVLDLSATDYIEFYVYTNQNVSDGNTLGGQSLTFCSGYKLL